MRRRPLSGMALVGVAKEGARIRVEGSAVPGRHAAIGGSVVAQVLDPEGGRGVRREPKRQRRIDRPGPRPDFFPKAVGVLAHHVIAFVLLALAAWGGGT